MTASSVNTSVSRRLMTSFLSRLPSRNTRNTRTTLKMRTMASKVAKPGTWRSVKMMKAARLKGQQAAHVLLQHTPDTCICRHDCMPACVIACLQSTCSACNRSCLSRLKLQRQQSICSVAYHQLAVYTCNGPCNRPHDATLQVCLHSSIWSEQDEP